jgi:hypothetical protein
MKKYSHMWDVAFTVENEIEDPTEIPAIELVNALQKRVDYLRQAIPFEGTEPFGHCDSYEIEDSSDGEKLPGDTGGAELPRA